MNSVTTIQDKHTVKRIKANYIKTQYSQYVLLLTSRNCNAAVISVSIHGMPGGQTCSIKIFKSWIRVHVILGKKESQGYGKMPFE